VPIDGGAEGCAVVWVKVKVKALFIFIADRKASAAVAFSAPLSFNSAALPPVLCYSFDVPGGYLVELTIGICTQGCT